MWNLAKALRESRQVISVAPSVGLFVLALLIGALVGGATLALIELIGVVQKLLFSAASDEYFASIASVLPPWRVVLAPVVGGLIVGIVLYYLPGQRYHGIADVMEACTLRSSRMGVRSGLSALFATSVSLGCGASLGREGPAVHIGASICAWIAEWLKFDRAHSLTLLGCGAAAAVTASFNAPIAGVLFALEVIIGYYSMKVFAPIVVASMGSVMVVRLVSGDSPSFSIPDYLLVSVLELPVFAALGAAGGLVASALIYSVQTIQDTWARTNVPIWLRPAFGGLCIGLMALWIPHVLGVGYQATAQALTEQLTGMMLLGIFFTKLVATALSLGCGFSGGVFSPSLVLGAMLGGVLGAIMQFLFPGEVSSQGVYSIVGMAAVASAMLGAPISTMIIVFELTVDYHVTIGVMTAVAMASTVMMLKPHSSFFRWQLARRGVNLNEGRDQSLLRTETIDPIISQRYSTIDGQKTLEEVQRLLSIERQSIAIATGDQRRLQGSMSLDEVVFIRSEEVEQDQLSVAFETVMHDNSWAILEHTSLIGALDAMSKRGLDYLPVVREVSGDGLELVGVVYRDEILKAYTELLRRARSEEFGVN